MSERKLTFEDLPVRQSFAANNDKLNETINTIRSKDNNRSLDKSGIDFMDDAKDYGNLIFHMKKLLIKGK